MFLEILCILVAVKLTDSLIDCVCKKKDPEKGIEKERQAVIESLRRIEQQLQQKIIENANVELTEEQKEIVDNEIENLLIQRAELDSGIIKYEFVPD